MSQIELLIANDLTYLVIVFLDLICSSLCQVAVNECLGRAGVKSAVTGRLPPHTPLVSRVQHGNLREAFLSAWLIQFCSAKHG